MNRECGRGERLYSQKHTPELAGTRVGSEQGGLERGKKGRRQSGKTATLLEHPPELVGTRVGKGGRAREGKGRGGRGEAVRKVGLEGGNLAWRSHRNWWALGRGEKVRGAERWGQEIAGGGRAATTPRVPMKYECNGYFK